MEIDKYQPSGRRQLGETMKPIKKTVLVPVTYWDCGNPDHRHKNKAVSRACIERREKTEARKPTRTWTKEAYAEVLSQYRAGTRQCDLAKILCLSNQRVRQILAKAERLDLVKQSTDPLDALSTRARNCLLVENLGTVEQIRAALVDGRINKVPNLGKATKEEIRQWMDGLPSNA